jgi:hypothetical protein
MINLRSRIEEVTTEASEDGAAAGWAPCSGCHETNEGAETGHYPYSDMFSCVLGSGCRECGGLGAVWHYHSAGDLRSMAEHGLCEDCPRPDYPHDDTRCAPCPRREEPQS